MGRARRAGRSHGRRRGRADKEEKAERNLLGWTGDTGAYLRTAMEALADDWWSPGCLAAIA